LLYARVLEVSMLRIATLFALVGCDTDQGFAGDAGHDATGGADIVVDPEYLEFGELGAGEVATQTFTISNVGQDGSMLTVSNIAISGAGGFTIMEDSLGYEIPGGGHVEIDVAFTPMGAVDQVAEAVVSSDDPDTPNVPVELVGAGLVPELKITPSPVGFGEVFIGCTKTMDVSVSNVGTDKLIVESLVGAGDGFGLVNSNAMPLILDPAAYAPLQVSFTATVEGTKKGSITSVSNEPLHERGTEMTAKGIYAGEQTDTWEVPTDPPADILFFVDQSCSMDDDQRALADNFSSFISALSTYTTDWHVLVANDDDGCGYGVLNNSTANYEDKFSTMVKKGGGLWTEAGLYVTSTAVDKTDGGECNSGFLRADALLHVITVSDEPDQSPGYWQTFVDAMIAKKGDAAHVRVSAVAGPVPGGCSDRDNSAEPGTGYNEAASYTGGEFLSICGNWSSHVKALAETSILVDTFALSKKPEPSSIVVYTNGTKRQSGWSYDSASNSIVFEESSAPKEGATVQATYQMMGTCD
jgi:hypothetical protein